MDHNQPPKSVIVSVVEGTTYVLDDAGYVPTDTRTFPIHEPDAPVRELRPVSEQVRKYENPPRSYSRIGARSFLTFHRVSLWAGETSGQQSTRPRSLKYN